LNAAVCQVFHSLLNKQGEGTEVYWKIVVN